MTVPLTFSQFVDDVLKNEKEWVTSPYLPTTKIFYRAANIGMVNYALLLFLQSNLTMTGQ